MILAILTFLPVNFQSLWGSLFQSCDIMWGGSTFCLLLSHKPTHIWKWEEGNPRWWLKGSCSQGEFSPHLFLCVRVCTCLLLMRVNVYITSASWGGSFHVKGIQKCQCGSSNCSKWNSSLCLHLHREKREICLSIYNLRFLAAMTVPNALGWICTLLK